MWSGGIGACEKHSDGVVLLSASVVVFLPEFVKKNLGRNFSRAGHWFVTREQQTKEDRAIQGCESGVMCALSSCLLFASGGLVASASTQLAAHRLV